MIKVGIIGAASKVAEELIKLLLHHDKVKITHLISETFIAKKASSREVHPALRKLLDSQFDNLNIEKLKKKSDIIFLAKPESSAMTYVPQLQDKRIIDLGADFRFRDANLYEQWYKQKHTCPEYLVKAVYGIPELYREKIKTSDLVANPGCYPTSVILGLAPLLKEEIIDVESIIINAVSGASGAGKSLKNRRQLFINVSNNLIPYNVGGIHPHIPEIEQELSFLSGKNINITFVPYVGSFTAGLSSTIYAKLKKDTTEEAVKQIYEKFYKSELFIRLYYDDLPEIIDNEGTNFCDIGFKIDSRTQVIIIVSVIDNLIKGAAGQAVQNMNLMLGFDETEGLPYSKRLKELRGT